MDERLDVHTWFGLSYAAYFVMPRAVLQAMPEEWQRRFTVLIDELNDALDWGGEDVEYAVLPRRPNGRFGHDPLCNYRHPPEIRRKGEPVASQAR